MNIYSQNIYEVIKDGNKRHVLIIYNISAKHYVGLTIYSEQTGDLTYIQSINKFIDIDDLQEYNQKNIKQLIYIKGSFLKIDNKDFTYILELLKENLIHKIDENTDYKNIENIKYLKWCYDKLLLEFNAKALNISTLKQGAIYWVDFGQNIGSELRKLRPAILWRSSADKKMWTVIPLSSKCYNDKYYFHYDIMQLPCSTAKIECMSNFSYKRIREPFFYNKKISHLSNDDYNNISLSIKKYYTFDN